jgi:hypothetical protein
MMVAVFRVYVSTLAVIQPKHLIVLTGSRGSCSCRSLTSLVPWVFHRFIREYLSISLTFYHPYPLLLPFHR